MPSSSPIALRRACRATRGNAQHSTPEAGMKTRTQIYWRERGGARRAYAALREYADVGGKREALVAPGETLATNAAATALVRLARRAEHLDALPRGRALHVLAGQAA